ncbi:hypothetical protein ALC62_05204 [Cyphomyrmex costatus]|uniref:Uncharacterized protein n=1 Tax=Cyphomyrmex costatus TaxID=456900 RepID=A0A151IJV0_9HYME|nr:hypothetical protein ALC62_05204 [Cyphomyrmex costatus]
MSMPMKGKHHHLSHHHHPQQHHQPQQPPPPPHHTPPQHQHQLILNQPVVHAPQTYSAVVTTNTRFLNAGCPCWRGLLAESRPMEYSSRMRLHGGGGRKVLFERMEMLRKKRSYYRSTPRGFHATFPRSTARGLKDPEKNDFCGPPSPFSRVAREKRSVCQFATDYIQKFNRSDGLRDKNLRLW